MKLKTVEIEGATYAVVNDGKPVYVSDDGAETAVDLPGTSATISRLNAEAKGHRERAERAETALKSFEGLDPAKAREAIDKLTTIDAKKLIDAGEAQRVRDEAIRAVEEKYKPVIEERDGLKTTLSKALIGNAFSSSKFASEKLTPAGVDLVRQLYAGQLRVEGDKIVPLNANGETLLSRARPGEVADFEEAISIFVDSYPHKEHILRGSGNSGSGSKPSNAAGQNGQKVMTRAEFDALSQVERVAKVKDGYKVADAA